MAVKIEAGRYSGKVGTWQSYEVAIRAYFIVNDPIEFLSDRTAVAGGKKEEWKKAQQKIHAHLIMTCNDRADFTLRSVDPATDNAGWKAYSALKNKYGTPRTSACAS